MTPVTKQILGYRNQPMPTQIGGIPYFRQQRLFTILLSKTSIFLADIFAVLFGLSLILPQSFFYGRPQLISTTFLLWLIFVLGKKLIYCLKRILLLLILLMTFLGVIYIHQSIEDVGYLKIFVAGPIYCMLVCIVAGYYQIHFPMRWEIIRSWILIVLAGLTITTLPIIINDPTISRILATNINTELDRINTLYKEGFIGYPQLYALAISFSTFPYLIVKLQSIFIRFFLMFSMVSLSIILLYSSLVLIIFCMLINLIVIVIVYYQKTGKGKRFIYLCLVSILGITFILNFQKIAIYLHFPEFSLHKTNWLFNAILKSGIFYGEGTGRGEMFLSSLMVFLQNPIFGVGFTIESWAIGNHSSFIDNFAYFGILGYFPMFMFQALMTWSAYKNWKIISNKNQIFHLSAWLLYWFVSVLNSTVFIVLPIMLLFVDFLPKHSDSHPHDGMHIPTNAEQQFRLMVNTYSDRCRTVESGAGQSNNLSIPSCPPITPN